MKKDKKNHRIIKLEKKILKMYNADFRQMMKDFRLQYPDEDDYPSKTSDIVYRDFVIQWKKNNKKHLYNKL